MNNNLKPYPKYTDSGFPWLRAIPSHWELRKFKYVFSERVEKGYATEPLLAATQTKGVVPKDKYEHRTVVATKDLHLLKLVEKGDYVISLRSFQGGIEYAHYRGIISPAYTILKPTRKALRSYFEFYLKSADFVDSLTLFVTGIREGQNIDYKRLSRSILPLPPENEQIAIGKFLRFKLQEIGLYLRAKRRQIELLNSQKEIFIQNIVSHGLDLSVQTKQSETDWLEKIPAHWDILRSKFVFREIDKRSSTGRETHLSMSQKLGLVPSSMIEERRLMSESYVGAKICEKDDIVLNRLKAHLGVFALAPQQGLVSPDYTIFRSIRKINPRYFELLLRTPACRVELRKRAKGIVQGFWRLYTDDFYDIRLSVPPLEEQDAIVTYLDDELRELNQVIKKINDEVELIRQYRARLISDVVTGKLDVREAAKNLPEIETLDIPESTPIEGLELSDELEEVEEIEDANE